MDTRRATGGRRRRTRQYVEEPNLILLPLFDQTDTGDQICIYECREVMSIRVNCQLTSPPLRGKEIGRLRSSRTRLLRFQIRRMVRAKSRTESAPERVPARQHWNLALMKEEKVDGSPDHEP